MIVIVAKNTLKEGTKEQFLQTAAELVEKSRAEEGNVYYDLYEDREDGNVLTFIEGWKDQEAIDVHNASEHFTRILPLLGGYQEKFEVATYRKTSL